MRARPGDTRRIGKSDAPPPVSAIRTARSGSCPVPNAGLPQSAGPEDPPRQSPAPARSAPAPRASPAGHRVTLVRPGLREPLPLAAAFRQAGRPGPGGSGRGKAMPTVGQDPWRLESRGWRSAFTLRLQIHPRPPPPSPPPARPPPRWRGPSGQERGRGAVRGTGGTGWAMGAPLNRANRGPGPRNRPLAIALVLHSAI